MRRLVGQVTWFGTKTPQVRILPHRPVFTITEIKMEYLKITSLILSMLCFIAGIYHGAKENYAAGAFWIALSISFD